MIASVVVRFRDEEDLDHFIQKHGVELGAIYYGDDRAKWCIDLNARAPFDMNEQLADLRVAAGAEIMMGGFDNSLLGIGSVLSISAAVQRDKGAAQRLLRALVKMHAVVYDLMVQLARFIEHGVVPFVATAEDVAKRPYNERN